jgi:hypothetical protein
MGFVATGVDLQHVVMVLAFSGEDEAEKFLKELGCVITVTADGQMKKLDCR